MHEQTKVNLGIIILKKLCKLYPEAKIALDFRTNIELLVATILSAQCTDIRVNQITRKLFLNYKTASDYASARFNALENEIRSLGLFHSKAKNIIQTARIICIKYKGIVPRDMQELTSLPGVGRKTANIILYNAFGKNEGIAVDTHVKRLSQRLGLTQANNPCKIEQDLMELIARKQWGKVNDLFIAHGRSICRAREPQCGICKINHFCAYNLKKNQEII
ncbi:MAG: endonuclease III [Candidatus Omnitrophica bacterium]|nr:endonuclease III [Candidatus Omnitrophota bacterium]